MGRKKLESEPKGIKNIETKETPRAACINLSDLKRQILKNEVFETLQKNFPQYPNLAIQVLNWLIAKKLLTAPKIKKLVEETQKNGLSLNKLLTAFGVTKKRLTIERELIYRRDRIPLLNGGETYDPSPYFLANKEATIAPNASEEIRKNHTILAAMIKILEAIYLIIKDRELGDSKIRLKEKKETSLSPEKQNFIKRLLTFLKNPKNLSLQKSILEKINYLIQNSLNITKLLSLLNLSPDWMSLYFSLRLSPLEISKKPYKPNHPKIMESFPAKNDLETRQRRALLDFILQALYFIENSCLNVEEKKAAPQKISSQPTIKKERQIPPPKNPQHFPSLLEEGSSAAREALLKLQNRKSLIWHLENTLKVNEDKIRTFETHFAFAKNYLSNPKGEFHQHLQKTFAQNYQDYVNNYKLEEFGIQINDYYGLVMKESAFDGNARSGGNACGYFQLRIVNGHKALAIEEVKKRFKINRINGQNIDINNPQHNIICGILYHKICRTIFTSKKNLGKKFSEADRLKLAKYMYNAGPSKVAKLISSDQSIKSYGDLEVILARNLCRIMKIPFKAPYYKIKLHPVYKVYYLQIRGLEEFAVSDRRNQKIKISGIDFSAAEIYEGLNYVRIIEAMDAPYYDKDYLPNIPPDPEKTHDDILEKLETPADVTPTEIIFTKKINKQIISLSNQLFDLKKLPLSAENTKKINQLENKIKELKNHPQYCPSYRNPQSGKGELHNFDLPLGLKFSEILWDTKTIQKLLSLGKLIQIKDTDRYVLDQKNFASAVRNRPGVTGADIEGYKVLHPGTKKLLEKISMDYQLKIHLQVTKILKKKKKSFPPRPAPLKISSLTRTDFYQKKVRNQVGGTAAQTISPHMTGTAFDIANSSFQSKNPKYREYYKLMREYFWDYLNNLEYDAYDYYSDSPEDRKKKKVQPLMAWTLEKTNANTIHVVGVMP